MLGTEYVILRSCTAATPAYGELQSWHGEKHKLDTHHFECVQFIVHGILV